MCFECVLCFDLLFGVWRWFISLSGWPGIILYRCKVAWQFPTHISRWLLSVHVIHMVRNDRCGVIMSAVESWQLAFEVRLQKSQSPPMAQIMLCWYSYNNIHCARKFCATCDIHCAHKILCHLCGSWMDFLFITTLLVFLYVQANHYECCYRIYQHTIICAILQMHICRM